MVLSKILFYLLQDGCIHSFVHVFDIIHSFVG